VVVGHGKSVLVVGWPDKNKIASFFPPIPPMPMGSKKRVLPRLERGASRKCARVEMP